MTHEDRGHYAAKQPGLERDERIAGAIEVEAEENTIACEDAENLSSRLGVSMEQVGAQADLSEMRIVRCQIGLFGYGPGTSRKDGILKPIDSVPEDLEALIRGELVDGKMPCAIVWELGKSRGLTKLEMGCICEGLGIKISKCQLGAF